MLKDDYRKIRLFHFWTKDLVVSFKKFKKSLYFLTNTDPIGFPKQVPAKKKLDKKIQVLAKEKKCGTLTVNNCFSVAII